MLAIISLIYLIFGATPKRNIPNGSDTLTNEEQQLNMQLQFERMSLGLKQRDDVISDLSKKNVELRGIVQNLQYYFTDQKVLFTNPKDPENAILRPEDLDILPTPQISSTVHVHNLSGRNLSLSNNSPQNPFNNPASSNESHTSKYIFGMGALPGFTFNNQEHGKLLSSTPGGTLHSPTTPATDSIPPVVLPELKVLTSGEEQEEVLFFRRARLYRFISKEWKERGIGELKILLNPETGKHRILMRRDVVKKLCCNHYITQDMKIQKNQSSEVTMNWYTLADFSDEVQQPEQFAARFKTVDIADEFEQIFNQCLLGMKPSQSPRSTDTKKDYDTDDVIIIAVSQPTEDQIRRARELMLPDYFYLYEDKPACPGCRGCDDFSPEDDTSATKMSNERLVPGATRLYGQDYSFYSSDEDYY